MSTIPPLKVTVLEDDHVTRTLLSSVLQVNGFATDLCCDVNEAMVSLRRFQPDAVLLDLHLGDGPSGIDFLWALRQDHPEIPAVLLSNHRSPFLIDPETGEVPLDVPYLIKDELTSAESVVRVVRSVLDGTYVPEPRASREELPSITRTQADLLRQIAQGMSNEEIAAARNTSVRAVDRVIKRTLEVIGVDADSSSARRVLAVKKYFSSGIEVRDN